MNEESIPLLNRPEEKKKPSSWFAIFPMFLVAFSGGALFAPHVQYYTEIFCSIYYNTANDIDTNLMPLKECAISPVQKMVSRTQAVIMFLTYASTLMSAGYYGRLSDRKGRRFVIRISSLGNLIYVLCDIITAHYYDKLGIALMFLGPLIRGIMAGESVLMASIQAYIADTTEPSSRTVVFARLMASLFIGSAVGPFVSSVIIKHTNSIIPIFYMALFVDMINVCYTFFVLPESNDTPVDHPPKTLCERLNVFSALKILFKEQPRLNVTRYALPCLALAEFLLTLVKRPPTLLYAMLKFHWTAYEGSLYYTCTSILKLTMMVGVLPLLSNLFLAKCPKAHRIRQEKRFKNSVPFDLWMIRIGIGIDAICLVITALASNVVVFTTAGMLQSASMLAQPSIRGLFTTLVNPNQVGELLGAVAILDSISMIVSHLCMNTIYSFFVNSKPQLIFYICSGIATCSCLSVFAIRKKAKIDIDQESSPLCISSSL